MFKYNIDKVPKKRARYKRNKRMEECGMRSNEDRHERDG
jgi:hypothetical protein